MKVIIHLGAHCTDGDELVRCLRQNTDKLIEQGIAVPEQSVYRSLIKETLKTLKDEPASEAKQNEILEVLMGEDDADRIVLSHEAFLGIKGRCVGHDMLYPLAAGRTPRLRKLFAQCEVEFFLGMRDPATFLPTVFERTRQTDFDSFLSKADPLRLRWSNLIARIQNRVPDAPITVWSNEDTPLIWNDLLRAISGHDEHTELDGRYEFLHSLMSQSGAERMRSYLDERPTPDRDQNLRVVSAFLGKYGLPEMIDQEIDIPGWSADYVEAISQSYDDDMAEIDALPGVTRIVP